MREEIIQIIQGIGYQRGNPLRKFNVDGDIYFLREEDDTLYRLDKESTVEETAMVSSTTGFVTEVDDKKTIDDVTRTICVA